MSPAVTSENESSFPRKREPILVQGAAADTWVPAFAGMTGKGRCGRVAVLAGVFLALAACGKKPDFPVAPSGDVAPRFYPSPALDPQPTPAPAPASAPAPQPTPPSPLPSIGVEDVRKPVDVPPANPGAPGGSAVPPGTQSGGARP